MKPADGRRGERGIAGPWGRYAALLAATAIALSTALSPVGPVSAQDFKGDSLLGDSIGSAPAQGRWHGGSSWGSLFDAPVIGAPDDPGRAPPNGQTGPVPDEAFGFNSFAAPDGAAPVPQYSTAALPVVVELFTSQGCSSCPPADAMLTRLAGQHGILPLSYHVDYWDYLGWADSFAQPEFTKRQEGYARAAGERSVYTPQLIVNGRDTALAPGPAQLMALIEANRVLPAMVTVRRETTDQGERIEMMALSDLGGPVHILLVRYAPERLVEPSSGENRGRAVTYTNVVLASDVLAKWDGAAPLRLTVRPDDGPDDSFPDDTRHALLVQKGLGPKELPGPILAAIMLD